MWIKFDKLQQENRTSRDGNPYVAYVLYGTRLGGKEYGGDQPYERIFFDNTTANVTTRNNIRYEEAGVVNFINNNVNVGDVIELKFKNHPSSPRLKIVDEIRFVNKPFPDSPGTPSGNNAVVVIPTSGTPTPPWLTSS